MFIIKSYIYRVIEINTVGDDGSAMDAWLERLWKKGRLSGPEVIQGSQSAAASGARMDLKGTEHNAHRDVSRLLKRNRDSQDVYAFPVPLWDMAKNEQITEEMHVAVPHETLDRLAEKQGVSDKNK